MKILVILLFAVVALFLSSLYILGTVSPNAYPVDEEGFSFMEFESGRIRYQDTGSGPHAVLFLHGFNGSLDGWAKVQEYMGSCVPRIIRVDLPGFGASDWQTRSYTLNDQAQRLIAFLDAKNVQTVTAVGASMGGSLAAWLAASYPERVKTAALLAPSGATGSLIYEGVKGYLYRPGAANRIATVLVKTSLFKYLFPRSRLLQALSVTSSYGAPWDEAVQKIQQPVAILWSKGDIGVPFAKARKVESMIANSVLFPLDTGVGHNIPRKKPELVAKMSCAIANLSSAEDLADTLNTVMAADSVN